jgi:hypothetical protein
MGNALKLGAGLIVAVVMTLSALVGLGSAPHRSVAYPNFVCATVLNYGVCVGPPTTDR